MTQVLPVFDSFQNVPNSYGTHVCMYLGCAVTRLGSAPLDWNVGLMHSGYQEDDLGGGLFKANAAMTSGAESLPSQLTPRGAMFRQRVGLDVLAQMTVSMSSLAGGENGLIRPPARISPISGFSH